MEEIQRKEIISNDLDLKELNKSVELLRDKVNEQPEKTVKVEQELARVKTFLLTQTDKGNKQASETQHGQSECNQKYILLEEENKELKSTIERDILSQLYNLQITSDVMDTKLQHVTDNLEMNISSQRMSSKK